MRIETSKGKTYEIHAMCAMLRNPNRVLIELVNIMPFTKVIKEFDGLETIKSYLPDSDKIHKTYEKYTRLVGIEETEDGHMRLKLEKQKRSEDA